MKAAITIFILLSTCFSSIAQTRVYKDEAFLETYQNRFDEFFHNVKEPKIIDIDTSRYWNEAYRVTILPSFSNPVTISFKSISNKYFIIIKKVTLLELENYDTVSSIEVDTVETDRVFWFEYAKILEGSLFYFLPENAISIKNDGEAWLVEGMYKGTYHRVYTHSPREGSSFYNLGKLLLDHFGYKLNN